MTDLKPRSRDVTDGMERAAARGMLRAVGMRDEDFAKPQIGIASSWNEITPCNLSLQRLGDRGEGGRAPRGRLPDGVRHDLGVRRHLDGPRRDALLAGQPRDHRRLGGDGRAGRAPRRHRAARGLRQEPARHADGRRPAGPRGGVRLRGLDPARPHRRPGGEHRRRVRGRRRVRARAHHPRGGRRHRARDLPRRGRVRRHVHREHDGRRRRGARAWRCPARPRRPPSTAAATGSPARPARPSSACWRRGSPPGRSSPGRRSRTRSPS